MSLEISKLRATITIDTGELKDQLNTLHDTLTSYTGVFGRIGMALKSWRGEKKYQQVLNACEQAARECAMDLYSKAVNQTPWDTKALKQSAYVGKIGDKESVGYEVGYDKNNAQGIRDSYGLVQHEVLWFNHPRGGKAKYLEDPYNQNIMKYKSVIKDALRGATK